VKTGKVCEKFTKLVHQHGEIIFAHAGIDIAPLQIFDCNTRQHNIEWKNYTNKNQN